jgi:hypothetical protein
MNDTIDNYSPIESTGPVDANIGLGGPELGQRIADYFDAHDAVEWQLLEYLFNQGTEVVPVPTDETLNPANFYKLLTTTLHIDDENVALVAVNRFLALAQAEHTDIIEGEESLSSLEPIEIEISEFIESKQTMHRLNVLDFNEALALKNIYDEQNLLAFAIETARRHPNGITSESFDYIYRYRTVVRRIQEVIDQSDTAVAQPRHKIATREVGWAGDIHDYSHDKERINPRDYWHFSGDNVDEEFRVITIDGVEIKVVLGRGFDE